MPFAGPLYHFAWAWIIAMGVEFLLTAKCGAEIEPLETNTPNQDVYISEFMASNSGKPANSLCDELGESPDWIELYNAGESEADLTGWGLTDNAQALRKWQFPPTVLPARSYLIVFASGRNTNVADRLHTNFKLAAGGGFLALTEPTGGIVSDYAPLYPPQFPDISYGRDRLDPSLVGFFTTPTPGAANATC